MGLPSTWLRSKEEGRGGNDINVRRQQWSTTCPFLAQVGWASVWVQFVHWVRLRNVLMRVAIPYPVAISMVAADDGSATRDVDGGVGDDHSNWENCLGGGERLDGNDKGGRAAKHQDRDFDTKC
ncbi:hypothetical protein BHE74_00059447 [Ensete ventricosum]|nr:hypothetical protein BHE74_00059447 [Ensete ventricosum]